MDNQKNARIAVSSIARAYAGNAKGQWRRCRTALAALALLGTISQSWAAHDTHSITDQLQQTRLKTGELAGATATNADLRVAAGKLASALHMLDQPVLRERMSGANPLHWQAYELRWELAQIFGRLGARDKALNLIEQADAMAWVPAAGLAFAKEPGLTSLADSPRFQAILRTANLPERLLAAPALATPYRDTLSVEERVAGLSLFWSEARHSFAYFDKVPDLDWNQVYLDTLSKVIAAPSTVDYYRVLMQVAPLLRDGHTAIRPPQEMIGQFFSAPPIRTTLVENKVMVQSVGNRALAAHIRHGDEVIAIDEVPVTRYAEQRIAPFVSSSTPQWRQVELYTRRLFEGNASSSFTLRLRSPDGKERVEQVARSAPADLTLRAPFSFEVLAGDVAYVSLDHFDNQTALHAFEQALPRILKAKGLILDVRHNTGGSGKTALDILSHLSRQPIEVAASRYRADETLLRAAGHRIVNWAAVPAAAPVIIARSQIFEGPVAVLMGPATFSAGEDFVVAFNTMKRGVTVGEASAGSTGMSLHLALPGGGTAQICVKRDRFPDGREFVGTGIAPDVEVRSTLAAFKARRDPVIERAAALLRRQVQSERSPRLRG